MPTATAAAAAAAAAFILRCIVFLCLQPNTKLRFHKELQYCICRDRRRAVPASEREDCAYDKHITQPRRELVCQIPEVALFVVAQVGVDREEDRDWDDDVEHCQYNKDAGRADERDSGVTHLACK
jgi:hypothetical protein